MNSPSNRQSILKEIAAFVILTLILSAGFWALIIGTQGLNSAGGVYGLGLMWCPGVAALVTRLAYHRSLRGLGWSLGQKRYLALAYVLPIAYSLVAYGAIWLLGLGRVESHSTAPLALRLATVLFGPLIGSVSALGEELGWRGLFVPQLARITSFAKVTLISWLVWLAWHTPLILFAGYHQGDSPLWYQFFCFAVLTLAATVVFNWLRLKSGSVWTAMLLHGGHNFFIQQVFDALTADTGMTAYFTGEFGAALPLVMLLLALVFWQLRDRLPAADATSGTATAPRSAPVAIGG